MIHTLNDFTQFIINHNSKTIFQIYGSSMFQCGWRISNVFRHLSLRVCVYVSFSFARKSFSTKYKSIISTLRFLLYFCIHRIYYCFKFAMRTHLGGNIIMEIFMQILDILFSWKYKKKTRYKKNQNENSALQFRKETGKTRENACLYIAYNNANGRRWFEYTTWNVFFICCCFIYIFHFIQFMRFTSLILFSSNCVC